jgi:DNA replication and repair protein RecF
VWVEEIEIADLRNIRHVRLGLGPGLNVFAGRNAQGKTSLLEAVGLLSRGRSFRTDEVRTLIRTGASGLRARGLARHEGHVAALEVELSAQGRRLRVDGREVPPRAYQGRLEVIVYSTERLKVIRGPMRERRQYIDRGAAALWPAYRQALRDYERVVQQRNALLEAGGSGLEAWDERLVALGATLRHRRGAYVARLGSGLERALHPEGETYVVALDPAPSPEGEAGEQRRLTEELAARARDERRARRTLVGPHRDEVALTVDGADAAAHASAGQCRSLLLALSLATLELYQAEQGSPAVALLDDLDSELDDERAAALCTEVARRGQALVTTAHPRWADRLRDVGRVFAVEQGEVRAA